MKKLSNDDILAHLDHISKELINQKESKPDLEYEDIESILKRTRITPQDIIPIPPVCLEILGPLGPSNYGTLGNFSAIIGKAKSKKTFLITMALATAIRNGTLLDKFNASLPEGKRKVIFFDTEQSKYHVQRVVKRICHLSENMKLENFDCFALRSLPTYKRRETIESVLNKVPGIGIIVIDGIRDLVKDINSSEESTEIINLLMKWSEEKDIHIIVVLHQNKGDNNARGHLGTETINKAESVISVTKDTQDPNISIVEAEFCRDKDFPAFAFKIDDNGIPYVLNDWQPPKEGKRTLSPFDYPKEAHMKILRDVFQRLPNPKYNELWPEIKYSFQQYGISGGDNKAKEWVKYYDNQGYIIKVKDGVVKYPSYRLSI
jgi:AAA domain